MLKRIKYVSRFAKPLGSADIARLDPLKSILEALVGQHQLMGRLTECLERAIWTEMVSAQ